MANAWIEIDLDKIISNYREVVKQLSPETRCMAVVKSDAYGMGAVEVASALQAEGCEAFAVTHIKEGISLREHGIRGLILILGPVLSDEWEEALSNNLQLSLSDFKQIDELQSFCEQHSSNIEIQLELETGMGRTGVRPETIQDLISKLAQASNIRVVGVFTHFARAAQRDRNFTTRQYEQFQQMVSQLEAGGVKPLWRHVCNSAAFLDYSNWHQDFVRIGTLLTGHYPSSAFNGAIHLQDPWKAKAKILHIDSVPAGTNVGYQSLYRTKEKTRLAIIGVGYADGFGVVPHLTPQGLIDFLKIVLKNLLALFGVYLGQEKVLLKGKAIPVAGKIGMQLTVLDIGDIECSVGDEIELPIRRTLSNPLLTRRYIKNGKVYKERLMKEGFSFIHQEYYQ